MTWNDLKKEHGVHNVPPVGFKSTVIYRRGGRLAMYTSVALGIASERLVEWAQRGSAVRLERGEKP